MELSHFSAIYGGIISHYSNTVSKVKQNSMEITSPLRGNHMPYGIRVLTATRQR